MAKKILIVDDEPDIILSVSHLLKNEGYEVSSAKDGAECLKSLAKGEPDLILMDFFMPGMSGRETIARIRQDPRFDGVRIIFMTVAEFREKGLNHLRQLGVSCCVMKPIGMKDMIKKVKDALK